VSDLDGYDFSVSLAATGAYISNNQFLDGSADLLARNLTVAGDAVARSTSPFANSPYVFYTLNPDALPFSKEQIVTHHSNGLERVKEEFAARAIPIEELLLSVEPVLTAAVADERSAAEAQRIVNGIERVTFTENEPERTRSILALLDEAIALLIAQRTSR
jgi:hypothetical protein